MEYIAGALIGFSLSIESFGFYNRALGVIANMPMLGYSLHVRLATYSRIGTFIGLPLLGYTVDTGGDVTNILIAMAACFGTYVGLSVVALKNRYALCRALVHSPVWPRDAREAARVPIADNAGPGLSMDARLVGRIGAVAFAVISIGAFVVNGFAAAFPAYRASLVQLAPVVTAIGTLISVTYFDPRLSRLLDGGSPPFDCVDEIIKARIRSALVLSAAVVAALAAC